MIIITIKCLSSAEVEKYKKQTVAFFHLVGPLKLCLVFMIVVAGRRCNTLACQEINFPLPRNESFTLRSEE